KHQETRGFDPEQIDIGDNQGPHAYAQFGQELLGVGSGTDAPTFGIKHLTKSGGGRPFLIEDEDVYRVRDCRSRGRHSWSIGGSDAAARADGGGGRLRGTCT